MYDDDEFETDQFFEDLGNDFDDNFDDDFEEAPTSGGYQTFSRSKVVVMIGHDGTDDGKQALYAYMDSVGADSLVENGPKTTTFIWLCGCSEEFQVEIKNMIVGVCAYSKLKYSLRVEEEKITIWVSDN